MAARWMLRIPYGLALPARQGTQGACHETREVGPNLTAWTGTHIASCEQENVQERHLLCLGFPEDVTGNPSYPTPGDRRARSPTQGNDQRPSMGSYPVGVDRPWASVRPDSIAIQPAAP